MNPISDENNDREKAADLFSGVSFTCKKLKLFYIILLFIIFIILTSCVSSPEMKQPADPAGCRIPASLDPVCPEDIHLLERIRNNEKEKCRSISLKECADREGYDFATAYFYLRESEKKTNRIFTDYLRNEVRNARNKPLPSGNGFLLGMIPGLFYDANRNIGGDGRPVRITARKFSIDEEIIPIEPTGSVHLNAQRICTWLKERPGRKIIIASLSKGALDFLSAYDQCGNSHEFSSIIGWLNLVGINRGTPLSDELKESFFTSLYIRWQLRRTAYSYEGVRTLSRDQWINRDIPSLPFPVINVVAVPPLRSITERASRTFEILKKYGPNDGLTLLEDAPLQYAFNVFVYGTDHYLNIQNPEHYIEAMLFYFIKRYDGSGSLKYHGL